MHAHIQTKDACSQSHMPLFGMHTEVHAYSEYHFFLSVVSVQVVLSPRIVPSTANQAVLLCTMRDYIRSDEQFQWFRASAQPLPTSSDKYSVVYIDGLPEAQNGMATSSPARLTGLIIADPDISDADIYTCAVNGTEQFATVELIVIDDDPIGMLLLCRVYYYHIYERGEATTGRAGSLGYDYQERYSQLHHNSQHMAID